MKVNTEIFLVKDLKANDKSPKRQAESAKTNKQEDRITLSNDSIRLVLNENKSASDIELLDFHKAKETVDNLKGKLLDDTYSASEIHQLGNKRILFLSLD